MSLVIKQPTQGKLILKNEYFPVPSLDLRFSESKSLIDVISNTNLITHTRQSGATYVGSDGLIKTATTNLVTYSQDFDQWSATNATVTPNAELAPDGTTTADQVTSTASDPWVQRSVTTASAGAYTFSVYIKAATGVSSNVVALRVFDSDGTIYGSTSISVTTEWQRYQISVTTAKPVTIVRVDAPNFATIGDVFYLWGAQLEQSSTVGEYIKTTSTINSAARFDHDPETGESLGLLVEESRTNLLLRSEEFDTTWSTSDVSVFANQTIAPDGNTTADKLVCGTGTPFFQGITQSITATASATRFSVYVKAAEIDQVELRSFSPTDLAIFELSTQQVLSQSGSPAPTITDAGNGWYRCSITSSSSGVTSFRISLVSGGTRTFTPISGAGIYLWGAQLEVGSFPTSYIPTTSSTVTRAADVASISGKNFGDFRYNLLARSEEFNDTTDWKRTQLNNPVINTVIAPDGTLTADKIVENTATSDTHQIYQVFPALTGLTYVYSVYLKAAERSWAYVYAYGTPYGSSNGVFVNLSTGSIGGVTGSLDSTPVVQSVGDGWYRVSIAKKTVNNGTAGFSIAIATGDTSWVYSGDGTSGIYAWGAQAEVGTVAGEYLKTTTTPLSVSLGSRWYNQEQGTLFADFLGFSTRTSINYDRFISLTGADFYNNEIVIATTTLAISNPYKIRGGIISDNVEQANLLPPELGPTFGGKTVLAYATNDVAFANTGTSVVKDDTAVIPLVNQMLIFGSSRYQPAPSGRISRLAYWPSRLPDSRLLTLTQ